MKNLAGDVNCDEQIRCELMAAGITVVQQPRSSGEVSTSFYGTLHGWEFHRAWYYWTARPTEKQNGLPLEFAEPLHKKCGQEARVSGHCGCPAPVAPWVNHFDSDGIQLYLDPEGTEEKSMAGMIERGTLPASCMDGNRFVRTLDGIEHTSVVPNYHVDTLDGLLGLTQALNAWKEAAS